MDALTRPPLNHLTCIQSLAAPFHDYTPSAFVLKRSDLAPTLDRLCFHSMSELRLVEFNQSGELVAAYTQEKSANKLVITVWRSPSEAMHLISTSDFWQVPYSTSWTWQSLVDVFLPAGYPASVTDDYLAYVA
jgi:hypothetical protein